MKWFTDLRIGLRLALAFGTVVAALLAVAVVGATSLGSASSTTDALAERDMDALGFVSHINAAFGQNEALVAQHLYVYDGDLKKQDDIQAKVEHNSDAIDKAIAGLRTHVTGDTTAAVEAFAAANKAYRATEAEALKRSRKETVDQVEERDGSRTLFTDKLAGGAEGVNAKLDAVDRGVTEHAHAAGAEAVAAAGSSRRVLIIVAIVAVLAAVALAFLIARSVVRPARQLVERLGTIDESDLTSLTAALEAVATGDLTVDAYATTELIPAPGKDELGQASASLNGVIEKTRSSLDAYNATREQLAGLIGEVSNSAGSLSSASQQMASSSEEAGKAVGEIASAVGDVAQGAERQVRTVEQTRRLSDEVTTATRQSAETVQQTAAAASAARELAHEGVQRVTEATEAMQSVRDSSRSVTGAIRELGEKSEQIGGIVDTITGIAGQTNLLALNAAIEAARAGEQGRGFAVVAEEVRKLAEESQHAASTIATLIEEIQADTANAVHRVEDGAERTDQGAATVEEAREAFLQIGTSVEDMHSRVEEIAAAIAQIAANANQMQEDMGEVAAVAEESSASAEQVSASTQQTSASTQEIAASAQELASTAEQLERLVAQFKLVA
jgi:methyl-accepting chemotaxis protein